jgi:6-phosphogluconolactonase
MKTCVEILTDKQALIERSLALVVENIQAVLQAKGLCTLVLSGGSTPKPLYEALATQALPWDKIHVFWGDERYVSADHPDSNEGMARQAWLERVDIPAANIHPMPTAAGDPARDAQTYEAELRQFFALSAQDFPAFDLVLLGMGDDGHTASLFPHTQALSVRDRWVTVGNKDGQPRLTLTVPTLNHARQVIFLVSGESKRSALSQIFAPSGDAMTYPARLIQPQGELWWLLDRAAGAELDVKIKINS